MENIQIVINAVFVLAVIWGGVILYRQNRSQKEMINQLKTYTSIIDIEKLKLYDSYREEAVLLKAQTIIENAVRTEMQTESFKAIFNNELNGKVNPVLFELMSAVIFLIYKLPKEEQEMYLKQMTHSQDWIRKTFRLVEVFKDARESKEKLKEKEKQILN